LVRRLVRRVGPLWPHAAMVRGEATVVHLLRHPHGRPRCSKNAGSWRHARSNRWCLCPAASSPGCRARDRFQQRAFAHGCLRLAAAIGRRTKKGATATAGPVSQTGVTKTRARSRAADTLVPRPDGRQAVVAHQLENDDLLERLSSDPVLHLVAPSMEVRAAYRRPIRRAITSGQVPAGHALRYCGRDRGDLVIRLVPTPLDDEAHRPLTPVLIPRSASSLVILSGSG